MGKKRKEISEMNKIEKKHYSLEAKTFRTVILGAILLGLVAFAIGFSFYAYSLTRQYIDQAFVLSKNVALILKKTVDIESMAKDIMNIYEDLPEQELKKNRTTVYRSNFKFINQSDDYKKLNYILSEFKENAMVDDLYCGIYDKDTSALIFIADPDERNEYVYEPGDWYKINHHELDQVFHWDGIRKYYFVNVSMRYGFMCTAGVLLFDLGGQRKCFILADITLSEIIEGIKNFALVYFFLMFITISVFAYLLVKRMKKKLIQPIGIITEAAQSYIEDKRKYGSEVKNHFSMLNIQSRDEIESLSLTMADMEKSISDFENNLKKMTTEKERINTELSLARRIQKNTLPNIFPPFPDHDELSIYAVMTPAKEVGGDFYDFFLIDNDHFCIVIADISGKGIPAAMFMMATKIMLANQAMNGKSPAEILKSTNNNICANNSEEMFVTVWLGILEISTGKLTAANAGHEYPVLKGKNNKFELIKDQHGFVVGGMPNMKYKQYEIKLEPGDKLFIYTDGVPEAEDKAHNLFGVDRMLNALNKEATATPKEILKNVRHAVNAFVKDMEQFDDLTMLCLEYRGKKYN